MDGNRFGQTTCSALIPFTLAQYLDICHRLQNINFELFYFVLRLSYAIGQTIHVYSFCGTICFEA